MSYRRTDGLGDNAQIVPSQYSGPVGGFSCNAAGGYSLVTPKGYMSAQCMTPAQLAAANAAYDAAPASQTVNYVPPSSGPAAGPPAGIVPAAGSNQNSAGVVGSSSSAQPVATDFFSGALSWIQANPWMAAAIAGGLLLVVKG